MPYLTRVESLNRVTASDLGEITRESASRYPCRAWFLDDDEPDESYRPSSELFRTPRGRAYLDDIFGNSMLIFLLDYHVSQLGDASPEEAGVEAFGASSFIDLLGEKRRYRPAVEQVLRRLGMNWSHAPCIAVFLTEEDAQADSSTVIQLSLRGCGSAGEVRERITGFSGILDTVGREAFGDDLWFTVKDGETIGRFEVDELIRFNKALQRSTSESSLDYMQVLSVAGTIGSLADLIAKTLVGTG